MSMGEYSRHVTLAEVTMLGEAEGELCQSFIIHGVNPY